MNFNARRFYRGAQRRKQLYAAFRRKPFSWSNIKSTPAQPVRGPFNFLRSRIMHMNQLGAMFSRNSGYRRPAVARNIFRFNGLGAVAPEGTSTKTSPSWLTNLTEFAKQALPAYQQIRILREQEKRRAAGLPPLESEQLAPTVRVQGGLDQPTMQLGKIALYGGLAIGGTLLAVSLMRRR